ncbi:MAG: hypothetical protein KGS09_16175 [Nitrospirae bacterium]|nr:hypothetical protein [Nitrospirota bacterium]
MHIRLDGISSWPDGRKPHAVADGLAAIYGSANYDRLKRGLRALIRGMKERNAEDRLHEFVRALEALIKPEISKTKRQFVHRCQTFAVASQDSKNILDECYEIQNTVEHMHPWENALLRRAPKDRQSIALQRLRQIESLALTVYQRINTSAQHAAIFRGGGS